MSIHKIKPQRTFSRELQKYTSYRRYLKDDFFNNCGYCGDGDNFYGSYHIDHFKPQSIPIFAHLHNDYNNLVYSCPFCNLSKSDTWLTANGFIDPCDIQYDTHLSRNSKGQIVPLTLSGENMYKHLKLYLIRHELIWMIEKLCKQKEELKQLRKTLTGADRIKVSDAFIEIQDIIDNYTRPYVD